MVEAGSWARGRPRVVAHSALNTPGQRVWHLLVSVVEHLNGHLTTQRLPDVVRIDDDVGDLVTAWLVDPRRHRE